MVRHRLMPHVKERALVCRLVSALVVWPLNRPALAGVRQWVIRVTRTPAFGVAAITPLVFAGAVGTAAPRFPTPTTALPSGVITPVAAVTAAGRGPSGPAVVAVERPPTSLHIAAATVTAPPPKMVVNSPGALGIPAMALSAYRNAEQMMAATYPGCGISWNLFAGIGRIESMHANGGATDARGTAIRPIYGPALDGTLPGNEVIVQGSADGRIILPARWVRCSFCRAPGRGTRPTATATVWPIHKPLRLHAGRRAIPVQRRAELTRPITGHGSDLALQQLHAVCPECAGLGSGVRHRRGAG